MTIRVKVAILVVAFLFLMAFLIWLNTGGTTVHG
jgi:hypothetical protein